MMSHQVGREIRACPAGVAIIMRKILMVLLCVMLPSLLAACAPKEPENLETVAPKEGARSPIAKPAESAKSGTPALPANTAKAAAPDAPESDGKPDKEPEGKLTKTASGIQVQDIVVGKGAVAEPGKTITVHYRAMLKDGSTAMDTRDTGHPTTLVLAEGYGVKGMIEGIKDMRVGGTRKIIVPPDLGYGNSPPPGKIPAGATLTFEVVLLNVK